MKKHTKIYMDFFGFDKSDFMPCEICGSKANDINHIDARGMGGSKLKDNIENLMAICRDGHLKFGDIKDLKPGLKKIHNFYLVSKTPFFAEPCNKINNEDIIII